MTDSKLFTCERCGYETILRNNLITHLKRKKTCKAVLCDVPNETLINQLVRPKNGTTCDRCGNVYANRQNLSRHRKTCNVPSTHTNVVQNKLEEMQLIIDKQQNEINELTFGGEQLLRELKELKNLCSNQINNINIQQNIVVNEATEKIRDFGCENMKSIPPFFISNCFLDLKYRDLLENLHFDPDYPENNNIRIKSTKRNLAEIYVNNHWMVVPLTEGLMRLIDQGTRIFKEHARKNKSEIIENDMEEDEYYKHVRELNKYDELDKKLVAKTSADLQAMLETAKNYDGKLSYTKMERISDSKESKSDED